MGELDEVHEALAAEGLWVEPGPDGPVLRGGRPSPGLMTLLKTRRGAVVRWLAATRLREWRWPSGLSMPEEWSWASVGRDQHPCGAALWRYRGEQRWRVVEGAGDVGRESLEQVLCQAKRQGLGGVVPAAGAPERGPEPQLKFLDGA